MEFNYNNKNIRTSGAIGLGLLYCLGMGYNASLSAAEQPVREQEKKKAQSFSLFFDDIYGTETGPDEGEKKKKSEKGELPGELQREIAKIYPGTNALEIMGSDSVMIGRHIAGYKNAHFHFMDRCNNYIFAYNSENVLSYIRQGDPLQRCWFGCNDIPGLRHTLSVVKSTEHGFILHDLLNSNLVEFTVYYVFRTSNEGPRFQYSVVNIFGDGIMFGDVRSNSYFLYNDAQHSLSLIQVDGHNGAQNGYNPGSRTTKWTKDFSSYIINGKKISKLELLSCNQEMSRLSVELQSMSSYDEDPDGLEDEDQEVFYAILDGSTGDIIKEYYSDPKCEIDSCWIEEKGKGYCLVRDSKEFRGGVVEYYDEFHVRRGKPKQINRNSERGVFRFTRMNPDLSRILWTGHPSNRTQLTYIALGTTSKVYLPDGYTPIYSQTLRSVECSKPTTDGTTLPAITSYPLDGSGSDSILNFEYPEVAIFLGYFKVAIAEVRKDRARVAEKIEKHRLSAQGQNWVYFPSRARAIIFEGSALHEKFLKLPQSLQRTLKKNYRDLFRIYPADYPQHHFRKIEDTPTRMSLSEIMSLVPRKKTEQAKELATEKQTSNKRKELAT